MYSISQPLQKWTKLFLSLGFVFGLFSACANQDFEESRPQTSDDVLFEKIDEDGVIVTPLPQPISPTMPEISTDLFEGEWTFRDAEVETSLTADDYDGNYGYRGAQKYLSFASPKYNSTLELNSDGTYTVTNQIIGGGEYQYKGNWNIENLDYDIITGVRLENLYDQVFNRQQIQDDFYDEQLAQDLETFEVVILSANEIYLINKATAFKESGRDAAPAKVGVRGEFKLSK